MGWLVGGVWIGAAVFALVLIGFCGYELSWKARRLRTDLRGLASLGAELAALQAEVETIRARADGARGLLADRAR